MSEPITLLVGFDAPEAEELVRSLQGRSVTSEMLPAYRLIDGKLYVDDRNRWGISHEVLGATDYMIDDMEDPHFFEFNHIANVTQYPEIRSGYMEYSKGWLI